MSCTISSHSWLEDASSLPSASIVYPSFFARSTLSPISAGLKWVSGTSVMSNRTVPSLKTFTPCFALRMPFSTGSGVLAAEISPCTPFISLYRLSPILPAASSSTDRMLTLKVADFPLEYVCAPHLHSDRNVVEPQDGQIL